MSTVTLTMPRLGETMEEGTVSEWRITEGQSFERGAPLVEFETDKTAVEYPALGSGRLVKILVSPGALVRLGEPIAEIDLAGAEDWVSATDADPDTDADTAPPTAGKVVIDLLMPRLGETMEEGKIISWMVKLGEDYARGASLLEVETDKTVAEFPALVPGRLVETLVAGGHALNALHGFHAFHHLAEHRVAPTVRGAGLVQEVVVGHVDEELGTGGVRVRGAGHGHGAGLVGEAVAGFVLDRGAGRFLLHVRGETATLDHEVTDHPVKNGAVIMPVPDVLHEVLGGGGGAHRIQLQNDLSIGGGQQHFHGVSGSWESLTLGGRTLH